MISNFIGNVIRIGKVRGNMKTAVLLAENGGKVTDEKGNTIIIKSRSWKKE